MSGGRSVQAYSLWICFGNVAESKKKTKRNKDHKCLSHVKPPILNNLFFNQTYEQYLNVYVAFANSCADYPVDCRCFKVGSLFFLSATLNKNTDDKNL